MVMSVCRKYGRSAAPVITKPRIRERRTSSTQPAASVSCPPPTP